jgi:alkaline phosphatase
MKRNYIILTLSLILVLSISSFVPSKKMDARPTNIILMIGDGMGLSQISYSLLTATQKMNFERFNYIGFSRTSSSSHKITDSGAGATAMSCGRKTFNGAIGVFTNKQPMTTILEMAEQNGLATGMVATCDITHATPASFIAHQPSRNMVQEIAKDFLATDIDLFLGGGLDNFNKRKDGDDLTRQLRVRNYDVLTTFAELWNYEPSNKKVAGLFAAKHLPKMQESRGDYLPFATNFAIDYLKKNKKGFFLMVEGSQIDWGGHDNDAEYIRRELNDFDIAIGKALDFAELNGNTLVIVTADHETGGFALSGNEDDKTQDGIEPKFITKNHTATMVPVFAYGPGAAKFTGIYENTAIFDKMVELFSFSR